MQVVYRERVYSERFWLIERDRRRERTAEVFVSVVSISHPVASHTHTHTHFRLLKDECVS